MNRLGLILNVAKTNIFWHAVDHRYSDLNIFPPSILHLKFGVRLHGGDANVHTSFIKGFVHK